MALEALAAAGLASNILQFIDFAAKVVSKGHKIHKSADGRLEDECNLESVCRRLRALSYGLHESLSTTITYDQNAQAITAICSSCIETSEELCQCLQSISGVAKSSRFKSYRHALKSVWDKDKVDALTRRLELFRGELTTYLLFSIRFYPQSNTCEELIDKRDSQKVDENSSSQTSIFDAIIQGNGLDQTEQIIIREHEKTREQLLNAILQSAQWGVSRRFPQGFPLQYHSAQKQAPLLARRLLLNSLAFREIENRFEDVPEAFPSTFEWMFASSDLQSKRSNFRAWLTSGKGVYWVNGKAGSGKSTLMKFICQDQRTRLELSKWANGNRLFFARFFFWKAGSTLQKSHLGLLRSLLHTVLAQCPALIQIVLQEDLERLQNGLLDHLYVTQASLDDDSSMSLGLTQELKELIPNWTRTRLERAIRLILNQDAVKARFCFFIDGLDEYDGDHTEIVDLFQEVASSPSVKACVSSRPLNVYQRAFGDFAGLRVQDLTEDDIRRFTESKLSRNARISALQKQEPVRTHLLVQTVMEKASGVFLWVELVVKSLLNGLRDHNSISELEQRLRLLPPDLDDLYRHMIESIDPLYRPRASRLFQIVSRADEPLHALALSLADEEDANLAIDAEILPMPSQEREERIQSIQNRVPSLSSGLLEVQKQRVQFLHRTVLDFFKQDDIKKLLQGFIAGTPLHPDTAILCSCILQLKQTMNLPQIGAPDPSFWSLVQHGMLAASRADAEGRNLGIALLDEFDRSATSHWAVAFDKKISSQSIASSHWTNWVPTEFLPGVDQFKNTFLTHAVRYQLTSYLKSKLLACPHLIQVQSTRSLLDVAIPPVDFGVFQACPAPQLPKPDLIELLLRHGADPNRRYGGNTPWERALSHVCNFTPQPLKDVPGDLVKFGETWSAVLHLLLDWGADIDAMVPIDGVADKVSALTVISSVLSQFDATGAEELRARLLESGARDQPSSEVLTTLQKRRVTRSRSQPDMPQRQTGTLRRAGGNAGVRLNLYKAAHVRIVGGGGGGAKA